MTKKQDTEIKEALVEFVIKVAQGNATSDAEINVLPEVINVLENATLTKKQHRQVTEAIFEFIIRVSKGITYSDAEIVILPKILR